MVRVLRRVLALRAPLRLKTLPTIRRMVGRSARHFVVGFARRLPRLASHRSGLEKWGRALPSWFLWYLSFMIKPKVPRLGAVAAVLAPSWGGPAASPTVFEAGLKILVDRFGFQIKEFPTTRATAAHLDAHPEERARDFKRGLCRF